MPLYFTHCYTSRGNLSFIFSYCLIPHVTSVTEVIVLPLCYQKIMYLYINSAPVTVIVVQPYIRKISKGCKVLVSTSCLSKCQVQVYSLFVRISVQTVSIYCNIFFKLHFMSTGITFIRNEDSRSKDTFHFSTNFPHLQLFLSVFYVLLMQEGK